MLSSIVKAGMRAITPRTKEEAQSGNNTKDERNEASNNNNNNNMDPPPVVNGKPTTSFPFPETPNHKMSQASVPTPSTASTVDITANTTLETIDDTALHEEDPREEPMEDPCSDLLEAKKPFGRDSETKEERREVPETFETDQATTTQQEPLPVHKLWQVLDTQLRSNIGTSVRCGICLSTITDPVRTQCSHSFCRSCIHGYLRSGASTCPVCKQPCTRRSLETFPELDEMADAYKGMLRAFGFAPGTYTPEITTMTQQVVDRYQDHIENDDQDDDCDSRFQRLCVSTTYQKEALPVCISESAPGRVVCSKLQVTENELVVAANFDACFDEEKGGDFAASNELLQSALKASRGEPKQQQQFPNKPNPRSVAAEAEAFCSLPNTQDVQEQAREQLEADREMEESMELDENENDSQSQPQKQKAEEVDHDDDGFFVLQKSRGGISSKATIETKEDFDKEADDQSNRLDQLQQLTTENKTKKMDERNSELLWEDSSGPPKQPSPPIFARADSKTKNLRHTRKSFSRRDIHNRTATAAAAAKTNTSPFGAEALSPIDHETSYWEAEGSTGQRSEKQSLSSSPPIPDAANLTGMLEDSRGGMHMMPTSRNNNNNSAFGETGGDSDDAETIAMTMDDSPAFSMQSEGGKGDNETRSSQNPGSGSSDFGDDAPNDAEQHTKDPFPLTYDPINNPVEVTDSYHESTKTEIKKAANLPAGPPSMSERRQSPIKKALFPPIADADSTIASNAQTGDIPIHQKPPSRGRTSVVSNQKARDSGAVATKQRDAERKHPPRGSGGTNHEPRLSRKNSEDSNPPRDDARLSESTAESSSEEWEHPKGTIVNVQARTWPGVNKQGGVGRIKARNQDGTYNVAYVLGGKESGIDLVFISKEESFSEEWQFPKGTIVSVQARTWPGVNKPGGVGRITGKNRDDTYNVAYVLGGKESSVDAVFISKEDHGDDASNDDNNNNSSENSPCSGRSSKRRRNREPKHSWLPEELRKQLLDEGFDIPGQNTNTMASNRKKTPKTKTKAALADATNGTVRVRSKATNSKASGRGTATVSASKRKRMAPALADAANGTYRLSSRANIKVTNSTASGRGKSTDSTSKRKRKNSSAITDAAPCTELPEQPRTARGRRKKPPPSEPTSTSATSRTKRARKATIALPKTIKKAKKPAESVETGSSSATKKTVTWGTETNQEAPQASSKTEAKPRKEARCVLAPREISVEEVTRISDTLYAQRLREAIDRKSVVVVTSNLSAADKAIFDCLTGKILEGGLRVKSSQAVDDTTTLCVVPTRSSSNKDQNTVTSVRTLKVMLAALRGIPMVTPDWVRSCFIQKRIVTPQRYIRTMPTKESAIETSGEVSYGVSKLTAAAVDHQDAQRMRTQEGQLLPSEQGVFPPPFRDLFVYLCGTYPGEKRKNLTDLLDAGGAGMLSNPSELETKSDEICTNNSSGTIVIICGGRGSSNSCPVKPVRKQVKALLKSSHGCGLVSPWFSKKIIVVDSQWIIESVTCAKAMTPNLFEPTIMKDLWKLCLSY